MILRWTFRLALALLIGSCGACSSYDARWKAAATNPAAARWEGRWTSEKHHTLSGGAEGGRLRAVTERGPHAELIAHFHADWLLFASDYSMTFQPKDAGPRRGGAREFSGTQELPKMFGGTYHYDASLLGDQLTAHYSSSYDHGTFLLHRVETGKVCESAHARH